MPFLSYYGVQRARFKHAARWAANYFARPDIVVVGEYHGANLGDYLLGQAVSGELKKLGRTPVLLTMHNLPREKVFRGVPIVLGGGNILDSHSVELASQYWKAAQRPPVCGVGLDYVWPEVFATNRDFFGRFSSIYFRSAAQADRAREVFGPVAGAHFAFAPDMVWLLADSLREMRASHDAYSRTVGINIMPLYLRIGRGSRPEMALAEGDPFHAQAAKESDAYKRLVCFAAEHYLSRGYRVIHLPFDTGDDALARRWLQPLGVQCEPYTNNIRTVMRKMASCRYFVPTRFHALLCAMAAGIPAKPIPYAEKNMDLLRQFGFSQWAKQGPRQFCENSAAIKALLSGDDVVLIKKSETQEVMKLAKDAVRKALESLTTK